MKKIRKKTWVLTILMWALFLNIFTVNAQGGDILINIDQNQPGEISQIQPSTSYIVGVTQPQMITVQVLAITTGLTPTFSIYDPSGVAIYSSNNQSLSIVSTTQAFMSPGVYRIVVSSGIGQVGQFLISLQGGGTLQPPQNILIGQVVNGAVSAESPILMYTFSASPSTVLRLTIQSSQVNSSPTILLQDANTGETLGSANARLLGAQFRIPASAIVANYRVQINYSAGAQQNFILCLESEGANAICPTATTSSAPPTIPTPTPLPATLVPLSSTGPCVVAPARNGRVNVRSAPSTSNSILGQLTANATLPVTGKLRDSSWYQVSFNGIEGWISGSVIRLGGQCSGVPIVSSSPAPTSAPANPTTIAVAPTQSQSLDFSLPANFGTTSLTNGFTPDPFNIGITSGGPVDVSYLGGGCNGFASSAPDFSVTYTAGSFALLRFYFVGNGDTTMIVNTARGIYFCNDDSFGTANPAIDIDNPSSGRYDIWIGSFNSGEAISGTLYVTEDMNNNP
jgi:SH3 domain-containing protein